MSNFDKLVLKIVILFVLMHAATSYALFAIPKNYLSSTCVPLIAAGLGLTALGWKLYQAPSNFLLDPSCWPCLNNNPLINPTSLLIGATVLGSSWGLVKFWSKQDKKTICKDSQEENNLFNNDAFCNNQNTLFAQEEFNAFKVILFRSLMSTEGLDEEFKAAVSQVSKQLDNSSDLELIQKKFSILVDNYLKDKQQIKTEFLKALFDQVNQELKKCIQKQSNVLVAPKVVSLQNIYQALEGALNVASQNWIINQKAAESDISNQQQTPLDRKAYVDEFERILFAAVLRFNNVDEKLKQQLTNLRKKINLLNTIELIQEEFNKFVKEYFADREIQKQEFIQRLFNKVNENSNVSYSEDQENNDVLAEAVSLQNVYQIINKALSSPHNSSVVNIP